MNVLARLFVSITLAATAILCHLYTRDMVGRESVRLLTIRDLQLSQGDADGVLPIEMAPGWMAINIVFKIVVPGILIALALYQLVPQRSKTGT